MGALNPLYDAYKSPNITARTEQAAGINHFGLISSTSWTASVLTINSLNHGLATGDSVDIQSNITGSTFAATGLTATVIDKDNFSVPMATNPGAYPVVDNVYNMDPQVLQFSCTKYSRIIFRASAIQIEALPAGTTVDLQWKVHPDATWVTLKSYSNANTPTMLTDFTMPNSYPNFCRAVRTAGTGQPVIYSQAM